MLDVKEGSFFITLTFIRTSKTIFTVQYGKTFIRLLAQ